MTFRIRRTNEELLVDCFNGLDCSECGATEQQHTIITGRLGSRSVRCPTSVNNNEHTL